MMDETFLLKSQVTIQRQLNPNFHGTPGTDGSASPDLSDGESGEPRWDRQGNVVAKRNARERTRVHTVNQAFLVLKVHLPSLRSHTKRVSKLKILKAAINYIDALSDLLKTADSAPIHLSLPKPSGTTSLLKQCNPVPMSDRSLIAPPLPYMPSLLDYPPYMYPPGSQPFLMGNPFLLGPTYT